MTSKVDGRKTHQKNGETIDRTRKTPHTPKTPGAFGAPTKGEERSREAPADSMQVDNPPELAKSFTASEARHLIEQKIQPIIVQEFEASIEGEDLITHKWSEKAMKEMLAAQQMTKEEKKLAKLNRAKKNPDEDFEGARYHFDGKDWFPVNGIKKAMVSAGFGLGIAKSIVQRCVFIRGTIKRDYAEIKYARIVKREDAVKVGPFNNRTADLRYRPEYQDWSMDLRIVFRSDIISQEQVLTLLEHAGFSIGIGEWRAEKDGQAGSFHVSRKERK